MNSAFWNEIKHINNGFWECVMKILGLAAFILAIQASLIIIQWAFGGNPRRAKISLIISILLGVWFVAYALYGIFG
jgi:hypothetical protein